jgi:hypothetical protein
MLKGSVLWLGHFVQCQLLIEPACIHDNKSFIVVSRLCGGSWWLMDLDRAEGLCVMTGALCTVSTAHWTFLYPTIQKALWLLVGCCWLLVRLSCRVIEQDWCYSPSSWLCTCGAADLWSVCADGLEWEEEEVSQSAVVIFHSVCLVCWCL